MCVCVCVCESVNTSVGVCPTEEFDNLAFKKTKPLYNDSEYFILMIFFITLVSFSLFLLRLDGLFQNIRLITQKKYMTLACL